MPTPWNPDPERIRVRVERSRGNRFAADRVDEIVQYVAEHACPVDHAIAAVTGGLCRCADCGPEPALVKACSEI